MITDRITQLKHYNVPCSSQILKFIEDHDCADLPDDEIEINGRDLFVKVMGYTPKPAGENRFETHQVYADLQYVAWGGEIMQTARPNDLEPLTDYDPRSDYRFYRPTGPVSDFVVKSGEFVVFYPNEAHRPSCFWKGHEGRVKKLVFKIKI